MMVKSNKNWLAMSDMAIAESIGDFIKHHRLQQNKTQQQIASDAGINRSTLVQLEYGKKINLFTLIRVLRVLNLLYVMDAFQVQEQISPLQLAKAEQRKRKRARNTDNDNTQQSTDW